MKANGCCKTGYLIGVAVLLAAVLLTAACAQRATPVPDSDRPAPCSSASVGRLNAIHFVNYTTGWAVGTGGTILKTDDMGDSWQEQDGLVPLDLFGVHFVDAETGWIVGEAGWMLFTEDAGENWRVRLIPTKESLHDIYFLDHKRGWAVGDTILRTEDGGVTWKEARSISSRPSRYRRLEAVDFKDSETGWVVGDGVRAAISTDGGDTWKRERWDVDEYFFTDVQFIDQQHGYIAGRKKVLNADWVNLVLVTEDGGQSWTERVIKQPPSAAPWFISSIHFLDSETGWVAGAGNLYGSRLMSAVYETNDQGRSWEMIWYREEENEDILAMIGIEIRSIGALDEENVWAVGSEKTVGKCRERWMMNLKQE